MKVINGWILKLLLIINCVTANKGVQQVAKWKSTQNTKYVEKSLNKLVANMIITIYCKQFTLVFSALDEDY